MRKIISLLLAVIIVISVFAALPFTVSAAETDSVEVGASSGTTGDCTWTLDDEGTLTISGSGETENYYSFYVDGSYITSAPWGANIKNVIIENGVTRIAGLAFYNCKSLTSVTIPDSVTSFSSSVCLGCTNLTSITVSPSNRYFDSRNNCNAVIEKETDSLIIGCKNTTIPDSVKSIGISAFSGCTGLTSVTIPDSVTSIGISAFNGCTGLTSVTIPDSVTSIGDRAFYGCTGLTSITIPYSVTSIEESAFRGCKSLTNVTIPDSVTSISVLAFSDCKSLTNVTIPDSVMSIGGGAFEDCTNLTSITIPDSVTSIGDYAFDETAWYENQPNGLVYAGKVAYSYKGDMPANTSIVLKDGTKGIADNAFEGCTNLTSITIPHSVTSIGWQAFEDCTNLTSITIPDSVTSIEGWTFLGCKSLTSVTIPDSVTSIGDSAFYNTAWYENQPNGLVYAGKVAYSYKGDMPANTSIVLKDGTKGIAGSAFNGCTNLSSVTIPDSVNNIGAYSFFGYTGCTNLTSVTISDSVTSIGDYAFGYYNCYYDEEYDHYSGVSKLDGFIIYGTKGSEAERYANDNGFTFIEIEPEQNLKIGDSNGDGNVDVLDATLIQKFAVEKAKLTDEQKEVADVNDDGTVDILDATDVQKYAVDKITEFKKK